MNADLRPYPEYKESGQEWLGKIPSHWILKPGSAAYAIHNIPNLGLKEKTVLSLSYGHIKVKPIEKQHGLVPKSYETYQIVDEGNIIIRGTDLQNDHTSLRIGLANNKGIITSAYICLETRDTVTPEYGYQILNVFDLTKAIYRYGSGLRQNLDPGEIKRLPIFLPPIAEQTTIVRFLEWANGQLEKEIRAKQKVISLLREQKETIIQHSVIRGIDPTVALKSSGISWLGEIPEHWGVFRSKYVFQEVDERSSTGKEKHLSMSQKYGLIPSEQIEAKRLLSESNVGAKKCEKGDLVLNRLKAHLGIFAIASESGLVSPDYTVFRPIRDVEVNYFEAVFRTPACRVELRRQAKGIVEGFWRLYSDDFYNIQIPVPPVDEQRNIMIHLENNLSGVHQVITHLEREIELLREYRTRLIFNLVTGKVDVREFVAKLPVETEHNDEVLGIEELVDTPEQDEEVTS